MARVGSIVGGAFRLYRERPGTIVIWAMLYASWSLLTGVALSYWLTGTFSLANPGIYMQAAPGSGFVGVFLVTYAVALVVTVVLINAAFRAVLRPEQSSFASLRLGMDEVRQAGLIVAAAILGFLGMFIVQLLLMLVVSFLGLVAGQTLAGLLGLVLFLGVFGAMTWLMVRLSLIFPLTLHRRTFSVDAGWELGRGRFWKLFGAYLTVFLVLALLGVAVAWAIMGDYIAALWAARGDPAQTQIAAAEFARQQFEMPATTQVVRTILGSLIGAAGMALAYGVTASARCASY